MSETPATTTEELEQPSSQRPNAFFYFLALAVAGILVILALAAYFMGLFGASEISQNTTLDERPPIYAELPELTVNLTSSPSRLRYLRLRLRLEVDDDETLSILNERLPRVTDQFVVYLRALNEAEVAGPAGAFHIKEELRRRANLAVAPARIKNVLIEEMLVQ